MNEDSFYMGYLKNVYTKLTYNNRVIVSLGAPSIANQGMPIVVTSWFVALGV